MPFALIRSYNLLRPIKGSLGYRFYSVNDRILKSVKAKPQESRPTTKKSRLQPQNIMETIANRKPNWITENRNYERNQSRSPQDSQHFRKSKSSQDHKRVIVNPIQLLTPKSYNPETFKWTLGINDLDNEYTTLKIKEVFNVNPKLRVMHYTDSGVQEDSLRYFIKNLKQEESFDIINVQTIDNTDIPFLKIISKEVTLKNYNEKLAQEKSKLYGRTREKKRESGIKYIKISWSISQHDLENQKRAEIESHLKKDQTIVILFDTKENLANRNVTFVIEEPNDTDYKPPKISELEEIRRKKTLDYLATFVDAEIQSEGDIRSKYLVTIKATAPKKASKAEKKTELNQKKLERQLKQQQREAEKKARLEARKKEFENLTSSA